MEKLAINITKRSGKLKTKLVLNLLITSLLIITGCKSTPNVSTADRSVSSNELKKVAEQFATTIAKHFQETPNDKGVFVALLATKNDTIQNLPVDVLDFSLVNSLIRKKVYTVRTEDRGKALEEIEFKLTGLADSELNIGNMKSPNFFIKMKIKENYVRQDNERMVEYTIVMEMRSVESQIVLASDIYDFVKRLPKRDKISW